MTGESFLGGVKIYDDTGMWRWNPNYLSLIVLLYQLFDSVSWYSYLSENDHVLHHSTRSQVFLNERWWASCHEYQNSNTLTVTHLFDICVSNLRVQLRINYSVVRSQFFSLFGALLCLLPYLGMSLIPHFRPKCHSNIWLHFRITCAKYYRNTDS